LGQINLGVEGAVRLEGLHAASWDAVDNVVELFNKASNIIDALRFTTPQDATTLAIYTTPDAKYGTTVNVVTAQPFGAPVGAAILPYNNPNAC